MSGHVSIDLALIVAALERDDPERLEAEAHAARCPECARILSEGEALLQLIDAQYEELELDPRLKARILRTVADVPQKARGLSWEHLGMMLLAVTSTWLAWFDGHARAGLFPAHGHLCIMWEVLGATLVIAAASAYAAHKALRIESRQFALLAMSGGLLGQLFLRWRCPTHDAALHLLTYHVTGVMFTVLLGLVASQLVRRRA